MRVKCPSCDGRGIKEASSHGPFVRRYRWCEECDGTGAGRELTFDDYLPWIVLALIVSLFVWHLFIRPYF